MSDAAGGHDSLRLVAAHERHVGTHRQRLRCAAAPAVAPDLAVCRTMLSPRRLARLVTVNVLSTEWKRHVGSGTPPSVRSVCDTDSIARERHPDSRGSAGRGGRGSLIMDDRHRAWPILEDGRTPGRLLGPVIHVDWSPPLTV